MPQHPRIAVGTIQAGADDRMGLWALLQVLQSTRQSMQVFFSQGQFPSQNGATAISGRNPRHLDSWLMNPQRCRDLFLLGARDADLSVIHGIFDAARPSHPAPSHPAPSHPDSQFGGSLDQLCDWLQLPRIVILDSRGCGDCRLPRRPDHVDAVLLDRVPSRDAGQLRTNVEAVWGVPVLGQLPESTHLRALVDSLTEGVHPSPRLCRSLGACLETGFRDDVIAELTSRPSTLEPAEMSACRASPKSLTVALAYDECFQCYFPNTLDLLEAEGAKIRTFSPLRDASLPARADLLYLGCGPLARFASTLANNVCLQQAIHSHLARGGRIYAEASGVAYLCRSLILAGGEQFRMSGVLPAVAEQAKNALPAAPVELKVQAAAGWEESGSLRGYLNHQWNIHLARSSSARFLCEPHGEPVWLKYRNVIGSRMYVDFAAQEGLMDILLQPAARSPLVV